MHFNRQMSLVHPSLTAAPCLLLLRLLPPFPPPPAALELGAQIKLVATCGSVACALDAFTIGLDMLLLWKMACDPTNDVCIAVSKYAFVFALSCVHHGAISYLVASRASNIMPLLNPVSSGAVRL
jgi:hypothetical protein